TATLPRGSRPASSAALARSTGHSLALPAFSRSSMDSDGLDPPPPLLHAAKATTDTTTDATPVLNMEVRPYLRHQCGPEQGQQLVAAAHQGRQRRLLAEG